MSGVVLLLQDTQGSAMAVRFPTHEAARTWEDEHPEVIAFGVARYVSDHEALAEYKATSGGGHPMSRVLAPESDLYADEDAPDPWGGSNPLGCCRNYVTEGGVRTHGGPDCKWPGAAS